MRWNSAASESTDEMNAQKLAITDVTHRYTPLHTVTYHQVITWRDERAEVGDHRRYTPLHTVTYHQVIT